MTPNPEAEALYSRGVSLHLQGRSADALSLYEQVIALAPDHARALNNRGAALQQLGRADEALASYDRALALKRDYVDALKNRALLLQRLKRHAEAAATYDVLLALAPHPDAEGDRGAALLELRRYEEALAGFDRALALRPGHSPTLSNRGLALQGMQRYDEAIESYRRALAADPLSVPGWNNQGFLLHELGRYGEALASFDKALALQPDDARAHTNKSISLLLLGDFENGWRENEWRWQSPTFTSMPRNFSQPLWLGKEDIAGKTILLHAEQGLGDTIQFVRYAPAVAHLGATVILEAPPILKPLLAGLPGISRIVTEGEPLPAFDLHCPLLSLPLAFGTRLDTLPGQGPYLSARAQGAAAWRDKLAAGGRRLVGLCWKGSATYRYDRDRSMRLADLRALLDIPDLRFVSLQKDLDDDERGMTEGLEHFIHPGADFQSTADLIGALDLVISVDTSWAHWAGAIGKPFWLLLPRTPHWCWLLKRADSPWYPTARLFRQSRRGEWAPVVAEVGQALTM